MSKEYRNNHYIPQWYQKRFVLNPKTDRHLHYLKLNPETFRNAKGEARTERAVKNFSFTQCFVEKDLYTMSLGAIESRRVERLFFGDVDTRGRLAVERCADFSHPWDGTDFINELLYYMSTQKLRTPKGLSWLNKQINKVKKGHKNDAIEYMVALRQMYSAVWMESVWLIADARKSNTKFIVSDHPVTIYNRRCPPTSYKCKNFNDPDVRLHGSHTLFPLSLDKVLILTNLSWVRNPYQNELHVRPNPSLFRSAIINITDIQTSRYLSEEEVRQINFILKNRAYKYIAAAKEEWLYPERYVSSSDWRNFGNGYLLMPDPRGVVYSSGITIGYKDGSVLAFDEYGRRPYDDEFKGSKCKIDMDFRTLQKFQGEFAHLFGPCRRGRAAHASGIIDNECDSDEYHAYHLSLFDKK